MSNKQLKVKQNNMGKQKQTMASNLEYLEYMYNTIKHNKK